MNAGDFWSEGSESKGVSVSSFQKVESKLKIKLPQSYIDIMKVHNGGYPKCEMLDSQKYHIDEYQIWPLQEMYELENLQTLFDLSEEGWQIDFIDSKSMCNLIVFAQLGSGSWCFDYRKKNSEQEPTIVFVDMDSESIVTLAPDFRAFIENLYMDEEDDSPLQRWLEPGPLIQELRECWEEQNLYQPTLEGINDAFVIGGDELTSQRFFNLLIMHASMCMKMNKAKETEILINFCRRFNPSESYLDELNSPAFQDVISVLRNQ